MPTFQFVARDIQGRMQRGLEEAASASAVVMTLRGRGWSILDVQPAANRQSLNERLAFLHPAAWLPIRSWDVELSLQQLAVMLRGGLTLLSAMQTTAEHCQRLKLRRVWKAVADEVQRGRGFAEAMAGHRCFPPLVVQLVRIGEQTGTLEPVLRRGAEMMERRRSLRSSLLTALAYPTLVIVAAIGVAAFMVLNVIPKLEFFLKGMGKKLPPMTQLLLDISSIIRDHGLTFVGGLVTALVLLFLGYAWGPSRLVMDRIALRLPVLGRFLRLAATALMARSLGMLLQSGVTLLEGLKTVELLHSNRYLQQRITAARLEVMQGASLAVALRDRTAYLPMLPAMIAIGESAGTLDDVLAETARFQEEQLQAAIKRFSAIIEPVIIVVVGSIVGFVYIAFFVAMFAAAGPGG